MLLDVVVETVLDRSKAEGVLNCNDGLEAISDAGELTRRYGVDGVPFFIVSGKITVAGAQQPDELVEAFRQAL